jgi:hypothetical protein
MTAKEHSKSGGLKAIGAGKTEKVRFFNDIHRKKKTFKSPLPLPIIYIT